MKDLKFYIVFSLIALAILFGLASYQENRAKQCLAAGYAPLYRGYIVQYCQRSVNDRMEVIEPENLP